MKDFIQDLVESHGQQPTRLLAILRDIQAQYHHIPKDAIAFLATALNITPAQIISVVEFYSFFHLTPRGRYEILISDSITDHMLGKHKLMDYLAAKLQVAIGAVRADGLVSLDNTSCTGLCDQGPAGLVNGQAIARLDRPRIDAISELIDRQTPLAQWPAEFFQVSDNIHKAGPLLDKPIAPGDALKAAYARGLMQTLAEIERSNLRGRGGAGFKTAMKWRFCAEEAEPQRHVVCNADEGEPGIVKHLRPSGV